MDEPCPGVRQGVIVGNHEPHPWYDPTEGSGECPGIIELPPTVVAMGDPRGKKATWRMLPVDTSNGECSQCGVLHEPDAPHNRDTTAYQYTFYAEHDRWPTWVDAMAHCAPEVQSAWAEKLREHGVDI